MRQIAFHNSAFEHYGEWAVENKKLFLRLQRMIADTARNAFDGIGKPEPLKGDRKGYWSRRINDQHRLVYKVTEE